ncbi:unnamed protein product [Cylicocyclus nassatus]|uniref:Uncharacterized protein n=1 Tax=Cylicocyclus nassatus TaxID=53992 RepID=A0AA36HHB2_CYLNA|nr:unnamed protein product [Cylicocyclus nassatus]
MNGTTAYDDLQRNLHKWSLKEDQQLCEIMDKQKLGTFDAMNLIRLKVIATKVRVKKLNSLVDELNALIENISQTKFLQQNVGDDKRQEVVPSVKEAGSRESETLAAIRTAIEHGINEVGIAGKEINAISALPDLISGSLASETKILRETTPIQDDLWEEIESQSSRTQPVETKIPPEVTPPVRREVENHAVQNRRRSSEEAVKERQDLTVGQHAHRVDNMKRPSEREQEFKNNSLWDSDSDEPLREKKDHESIVRVESTSIVPEKRVRAVADADEGSSSVVKKPQIDRSSIHRDMQRDLEEIFQRRSKAKPETSGERSDSLAIPSSSDHLRPTTVRASTSPSDNAHEKSESLHTSRYSREDKDKTLSTSTEDKLERFMSGDGPMSKSKEPSKPSKEPVSIKAVTERKQTVESVSVKPAPVSSNPSQEIFRNFPSERILGARVAEKYKSIFDDEDDDDDLFDIKPKKEHVKVAAEPPKKAPKLPEWEPPRKAKTSLPESEPPKKAESSVPDSGPLREAQSSLPESEPPKKAESSVPDSGPLREAQSSLPDSEPTKKAESSVPDSEPLKKAQSSLPDSEPPKKAESNVPDIEPLKKAQSSLPEPEPPRNSQSSKSEPPKKAPSRLPESQFAKLLGEKLARGPVQPSDTKPVPVTSTEPLLTIDSSIQENVTEGSTATSARPFTPLASVTKNRTRGPNRRPPTNRMAATATTNAHGTDDVLEKTAEQHSGALSDNVENTHTLVTEREAAPSVEAREEAPLGPLGGTEQASVSTLSTAAGTPLDISNGGKDKASVFENVITRPPMWLDENTEETPTVSEVISNSKTIVHVTSKVNEKPQQESASTKQTSKISQDIGTSRSSQSHIDTKQHNPVKSFFDADSDDDNEDYPPVTKRQDEPSRSTELPKTTKLPDVKAASSVNKSVKPIIITAQSLFDDDDDSDLSIFQIPMRMPSKLADSQFSKLLGEKLARGPAQPHDGRSTASSTNASSRPSEFRMVSESDRKHREHASSSDFKPLETVTKSRTRGPNRKPRSSRRGVVAISSEGRVQVAEKKGSKENVPVPTQPASNAKTTFALSSCDNLTKKSDSKSENDKKTSALPSRKEDAKDKIETPSIKTDRKTTLRIGKVAVLEGKSDIDKTGVELVQRVSQNET